VSTLAATSNAAEKTRLWQSIQRQLAEGAINVFIWNPAQVTVFRKGLSGLWNSSLIFANDMGAVRWA
jgi:peptide/nickel transport system substrate-binding protein